MQSIKLDKLEGNHAQANLQVISLMKEIGTVKKGDLVIITKGDLLGTSGGTNAMKVVEVGNMIEFNVIKEKILMDKNILSETAQKMMLKPKGILLWMKAAQL